LEQARLNLQTERVKDVESGDKYDEVTCK